MVICETKGCKKRGHRAYSVKEGYALYLCSEHAKEWLSRGTKRNPRIIHTEKGDYKVSKGKAYYELRTPSGAIVSGWVGEDSLKGRDFAKREAQRYAERLNKTIRIDVFR